MLQYHTYQEIIRQPKTWEETINLVLNAKERIKQIFDEVKPDEVLFIGCGTSYYISITAALTFEAVTGVSAKAVPASEIFLKPEAVINKKKKTIIIGSSRSGNTTEVVRAIDYVQKNNLAECISITGYPDSKLADITKNTIVLPHIQEKSVVMTSSFTNILLSLQLIAGIVSDDKGYIAELRSLPKIGNEIMPNAEQFCIEIGEDLSFNHYIYLGLGSYYGLACEGMLKMKEMTQVFAEAFNPLEFRHGPISVVNQACRVILLSNHSILDYEQEVINDIRKFDANTVVLGELSTDFTSDYTVNIRDGLSDNSRGILYLPYLQFMSYFRTLKMGLNPDQPRNLTQVVTF
jgi:glucosamine--fructose-6-phosphate aminotransferase (isomerizing)